MIDVFICSLRKIPKRDEVLIRGVFKRGRWYGDIPGHVKSCIVPQEIPKACRGSES